MTNSATAFEAHLQAELGKRVMGMDAVIHALAIAAIARGHVLMEGPPGLGKTRLSKAFAEVLGGAFKRIQGTADLMPSDITGVHIFNTQSQQFEFQTGPLFAVVVLFDELNRAGPKTQSALLEAMEERQVTIDRETFTLTPDFLVIATRNPQEYEGTFPLPESQLDRFALSLSIDYLSREQEAQVLTTYNLPDSQNGSEQALQPLPQGLLAEARECLQHIHLSEELVHYVLDIATATRKSASISLGLSVRGALALARTARIETALHGGDFVVPDDVKAVAAWVIGHRLQLTPEAAIDGLSAADALDRVLEQVPVPK